MKHKAYTINAADDGLTPPLYWKLYYIPLHFFRRIIY